MAAAASPRRLRSRARFNGSMSPRLVVILWLGAVGVFVWLAYRRHWRWTGLPGSEAGEHGQSAASAKTLWDWLQLLGIPAALVALAFLLNDSQARREEQRGDRQAAQLRRAATDAERESTLRAYLDQMFDLILNRELRDSQPYSGVRKAARTTTLTAVRRLDGARRGIVVRFLTEDQLLGGRSGLPRCKSSTDAPPVNMLRAELSGADLSNADLTCANLVATHLIGASLTGADLTEVRLCGADLSRADLRHADLSQAHLNRGILALGPICLPASRSKSTLNGTDLRGANLRGANLRGADLRGASLRGANIQGTDLRGSIGADLTGAHGTPARGP